MPHDTSIRIFFLEILEKLIHGVLLSLSACIAGLTVLVETAFVADAKRAVVVMPCMNALHRFWQQGDDIPVSHNIIVIRTLAVFCLTCGNEGFNAERAVAFRGTAMNYQEFYVGVP